MKDSLLSLYDRLGFDTLPLPKGGREANLRSWQSRPSRSLWRNAPADANIAIRGGGEAHVAIVDCDEKNQVGTFDKVTTWLDGLGLHDGDYPVVQSASGIGRHVYVAFEGGLTGDYRDLSNEIGAGEFRYGPGAYAVAPPSLVEGGIYVLLNGQFERLPTLTLNDVLPILGKKENKAAEGKPNIPRLTMAILKGNAPDRYKSRSEAEQAALASLANVGFEYADVLNLFHRYPGAGKYAELRAENPNNADRWLAHSYAEAQQFVKASESKARQTAAAALDWAISAAWQGRTGIYDQGAYIAASEIAYKAGKLQVALACRDVAELAGYDKKTASKALRRLVAAKLLTIPEGGQSIGECATVYRLTFEGCKVGTLPKYPPVRECTKFARDTFRKGRGKTGLPPSSRQLYEALQQQPATIAELHERTGRDRRTIRGALEKMSKIKDRKTGEYLPMVERDGDTWKALSVDLDLIAEVMGTAGMTHKQKVAHEKERRAHARDLRAGALSKSDRTEVR